MFKKWNKILWHIIFKFSSMYLWMVISRINYNPKYADQIYLSFLADNARYLKFQKFFLIRQVKIEKRILRWIWKETKTNLLSIERNCSFYSGQQSSESKLEDKSLNIAELSNCLKFMLNHVFATLLGFQKDFLYKFVFL